MSPKEWAWKRQPNGQYVARHGFWVYTVFRTDMAPRGRQWIVQAYPEGNPGAIQQRPSLANAKVAKLAAAGTRCFLCGRTVPFGTLEPYNREKSRNLMLHTWRCREHVTCELEREKLLAATGAEDYAEMLDRITAAKARVRELEAAALKLRDEAIASGVTEAELYTIEHARERAESGAGARMNFPIDIAPAPADSPALPWRAMDDAGATTDHETRTAAYRAAADLPQAAVYVRRDDGEWWRYETLTGGTALRHENAPRFVLGDVHAPGPPWVR